MVNIGLKQIRKASCRGLLPVAGTRKGSNFYTDIQALVDAHTLVDDDAV